MSREVLEREVTQMAPRVTGTTSARPPAPPPPENSTVVERRKAERRERYKDDPFYIDPEGGSGAVTPLSRIVRDGNKDGNDLDIDSIPVMQLDLSAAPSRHASSDNVHRARSPRKPALPDGWLDSPELTPTQRAALIEDESDTRGG